MIPRHCIILILLATLLATRLLDVHFHLPAQASQEAPHVVATALIEAHQHNNEPDHGHLAAHLYEGETDEGEGAGLVAKLNAGAVLLLALLLSGVLPLWPRTTALRLPRRADESPPPTRRRAHLAPPSQAPPYLA